MEAHGQVVNLGGRAGVAGVKLVFSRGVGGVDLLEDEAGAAGGGDQVAASDGFQVGDIIVV
jgi:hypothetical protein